MSKTLILMRHAKSSWDTPGLADHARPLNERGTRSAKALGDWMRSKNWLPDQVICSAATRTRDTLSGLALGGAATFTDNLYHASATQMLRVLSQATGQTVLIVGHNPGLADFAAEIVAEPPGHPRFDNYPTGATLVVRFEIDNWNQVAWRGGTVADFVVPRELPGVGT